MLQAAKPETVESQSFHETIKRVSLDRYLILSGSDLPSVRLIITITHPLSQPRNKSSEFERKLSRKAV